MRPITLYQRKDVRQLGYNEDLEDIYSAFAGLWMMESASYLGETGPKTAECTNANDISSPQSRQNPRRDADGHKTPEPDLRGGGDSTTQIRNGTGNSARRSATIHSRKTTIVLTMAP